jgi:hypothetical protein
MVTKPWFKAKFDSVLALRPTGWTHSNKLAALTQIKPVVKGKVTCYGMGWDGLEYTAPFDLISMSNRHTLLRAFKLH